MRSLQCKLFFRCSRVTIHDFPTRPLTEDQLRSQETLIVFSIIDMNCTGDHSQFIADCLMMFKDIPKASTSGDLVPLTLYKPNNIGMFYVSFFFNQLFIILNLPLDDDKIIRILEKRSDDDIAIKFLFELNRKTMMNGRSYRLERPGCHLM